MKIERFEDIRAWRQARELANLVYDLTERGSFSKDFRLRDQIQAAAGSIMHNIAEGFDDGSDTEFVRFLKYARRSASEVQSEIYLALDRKYISTEDFKCVYSMATSTKKSINAFIAYLRKSRHTPTPHPETTRPRGHETTRLLDYLTARLPDYATIGPCD